MTNTINAFIGSVAISLDTLGIFVFAVSGAFAAARRGLDIFGICVIAFLPALGGGTLRDMVIGAKASWINQPETLGLPITAAALVVCFNRFLIGHRLPALIWADAIGLAAFSALGAQLGWEVSGSVLVATLLGIMPAVAGGALRDVVLNEVPLILHADIYASAAAVGAFVTALSLSYGAASGVALAGGFCAALLLRTLGIIFDLRLPTVPPPRE